MGERTKRSGDDSTDETVRPKLGSTVYDEDGTELGTIRGFESDGFFVTTREGVESLSVEHARAGHGFGEAELMWRCINCGETAPIDSNLPDTCPGCGGPREDLMYWTED